MSISLQHEKASFVLNEFLTRGNHSLSPQEIPNSITKIVNLVGRLELNTVGFLPQEDKRIWSVWFEVKNEFEVAVVTRFSNRLGVYKDLFFGVMSSNGLNANRVFEVAVLRTKETEIGKIDWGEREGAIFEEAIHRPIPGMIPVIAINKHNPIEKMKRGFTAAFPRFTCDLFQILFDEIQIKKISPQVKWHFQEELLKIVAQFHEWGIHRDIKPENVVVLITPPKTLEDRSRLDQIVLNHPETRFDFRLIDPGFAMRKNDDLQLQFIAGSLIYLSPELVQAHFNRLSDPNALIVPTVLHDTWACGLILLLIEDGSLFREVIGDNLGGNLKERIYRRYRKYYDDKKIACFPEPENQNSIRHIIWELLNPVPSERLSLEHALRKMEAFKMLTTQFQLDAS
jgi:serine/threonine protein kinase